MLIGMAACGRRISKGPGKWTAANVCIIPARQSNPPITANGFIGKLSWSLVIALLNRPNFATGTMYANDNGMNMNVVNRLRKRG